MKCKHTHTYDTHTYIIHTWYIHTWYIHTHDTDDTHDTHKRKNHEDAADIETLHNDYILSCRTLQTLQSIKIKGNSCRKPKKCMRVRRDSNSK